MQNPSPTIGNLPPALPAGGGYAAEPHGALYLVLGYLLLPDLLASRRVCRALRDEVDADELLWRHITVDLPLSGRLTDHILSRIASFARGKLRSLALLRCPRITDAGLMQVVDQNPTITKLYIPGCTSITPDVVVRIAKRLAEQKGRLECIRINGLYNIKEEHVNVLKLLIYKSLQQEASSKFFYSYRYSLPFKCDDERPIDVDICPKCKNVRMVYDCTRDDCRTMKNRWIECRGCFFCIERCEECGGCLDAEDFGEDTACSHLFCAACWLEVPKCNICNLPCCKKDASAGLSSTGFEIISWRINRLDALDAAAHRHQFGCLSMQMMHLYLTTELSHWMSQYHLSQRSTCHGSDNALDLPTFFGSRSEGMFRDVSVPVAYQAQCPSPYCSCGALVIADQRFPHGDG